MKKAISIIALILCAGFWAGAQTISLEQARTLGLANSRSLAKYNLSVQSGILDERAQLYTNLPSLSLGLNASMTLWNSGGKPVDKPFDTISGGASFGISQKLFEGGKSFVQKAIKELTTESARRDALAEYFNVLDAVDSACYAVLQAAADLESAESTLANAEISLSIAEVRQATGQLNRGDYLKALSEKASRETARNQARRALSLSQAKLKSLLGAGYTPLPEEVDFSVYENVLSRLESIPDDEADILFNELWKIVAQSNPTLAKAGLTSQKAEKNLTLSMQDFSPTLSASFSTGLNYAANSSNIETAAGSIRISGTIPLDFWVIGNNVAKSKIARDTALMDYHSTENNMINELQTALLNTIAQAGSVLSSQRALEYAESHSEYIMERFRLSQSSVSEVSDANALVSSNRAQYNKARYGFLESFSKLRTLGAFDDEEKLMLMLTGVSR